jgi:hypothetical protein
MKKYQIHTTLSAKHLEILKNNAEKYGSQQKALELALESFQSQPKPTARLSPEEELWKQFSGNNMACFIQKEGLKMLLETANMAAFVDVISKTKPIEYQIESYYNKPLKDCSLEEVIHGMVINARMSHWFDEVDYRDQGSYYTIKWGHCLGINGSKMTKILPESVFRTYGAKFDTTVSEKTVFMKVYKNA